MTPNVIIYGNGIAEYSDDYGVFEAELLRQLSLGMTHYVSAGSNWWGVNRQYKDEADAKTNPYLRNMMRLRAEHPNMPVALVLPFGDNAWGGPKPWNGVDDAARLIRSGNLAVGGGFADPCDPEYLECCHTALGDGFRKSGKATVQEYIKEIAGGYPVWVQNLLCPWYRGKFYQAAMQKMEEFLKWIKPDALVLDIEAYGAVQQLFPAANGAMGSRNQTSDSPTRIACSRCKDLEGYWAGKNDLMWRIAMLANEHNPKCIVTNFAVFRGAPGATHGPGPYFDFGVESGITHGVPSLYHCCRADDPAAELERYAAMPTVPNATGFEAEEAAANVNILSSRRIALTGSFPAVTHIKSPGVYVDSDAAHDLGYAIARHGAIGVQICPAYGENKTSNEALDHFINAIDAGMESGKRDRLKSRYDRIDAKA